MSETILQTEPNLADADGFYAALIAATQGRSEAESLAFTLRLVLILANQIGDLRVLAQAVAAAHGESAAPA